MDAEAALVAADSLRDDKTHAPRGGVQSIERAFAILSRVAHNDGISLSELSKQVGLHSSTTFHIVRTMVELGIVRQGRDTKRYHLGRVIFALAASSSSEVQLIITATPFLEDLAKFTGESTHLGLRSGFDAVIAARFAGGGAFQMVERFGGVRPLHCTSIGKVLLAGMSDDLLRQFVHSAPLPSFTPKTLTDPDLLWGELMRVRETGLGYDDSEFNEEVRCVAAPIHDFSGGIAGAIGVSGPVWRINLQRLACLSEQVRDAARRISRELGHEPEPTASKLRAAPVYG